LASIIITDLTPTLGTTELQATILQ
jgi:hypothetical protein